MPVETVSRVKFHPHHASHGAKCRRRPQGLRRRGRLAVKLTFRIINGSGVTNKPFCPASSSPSSAFRFEADSEEPAGAPLDETGQRTERPLTPSMRISALPAEGSPTRRPRRRRRGLTSLDRFGGSDSARKDPFPAKSTGRPPGILRRRGVPSACAPRWSCAKTTRFLRSRPVRGRRIRRRPRRGANGFPPRPQIYETTGIEGNSLDLSETRMVIERGITISGKPSADSREVKNMEAALGDLKDLWHVPASSFSRRSWWPPRVQGRRVRWATF